MIEITATLSTPGLDRLIAELPTRLQGACTVTGQAIQKEFEATSVRLTGSLAMSVALVTSDGAIDDSAARSALADALNPHVRVLPMEPPPPPPGALVQVRAEHGEFVEYGTTRMAARPRWTPAVEGQRDPFKARVSQALEP